MNDNQGCTRIETIAGMYVGIILALDSPVCSYDSYLFLKVPWYLLNIYFVSICLKELFSLSSTKLLSDFVILHDN